jgi:DNA-binding MarR family transcriptional regulator
VDAKVDLSECINCYCLAARKTARSLTRLFEARLRPHGLRATQFSILAALAISGPARISELARALGLDRTTLTRSAALLERNGWVESGQSDDGREHPLRLTQAGRGKVEAAFPAWKEAQEAAGRTLGGGLARIR